MTTSELKPIGPIERAIDALDHTIKILKANRAELVAQLPKRPAPRDAGFIMDPKTGKKIYYIKKRDRYET